MPRTILQRSQVTLQVCKNLPGTFFAVIERAGIINCIIGALNFLFIGKLSGHPALDF